MLLTRRRFLLGTAAVATTVVGLSACNASAGSGGGSEAATPSAAASGVEDGAYPVTIEHKYGEYILDRHFPSPGTPTQSIDAGYMANAWMRLRHPDYDQLRSIMDEVGRTVRVRAR